MPRLVNKGLVNVLALAKRAASSTAHPFNCLSIDKTFWVQLYFLGCQLLGRLVQCLSHLSKVVRALHLRVAHLSCLCLSRPNPSCKRLQLLIIFDLLKQLIKITNEAIECLALLLHLQVYLVVRFAQELRNIGQCTQIERFSLDYQNLLLIRNRISSDHLWTTLHRHHRQACRPSCDAGGD